MLVMLGMAVAPAPSLEAVRAEPPGILRESPSPTSLRAWHDLLGAEPHIAGTPGDARQIERLRGAFVGLGLEVEVQEIHPLLCTPIDALLEIEPPADGTDVATTGARGGFRAASPADAPEAPRARRGVVALDLRERNLLEDPSTAHPDLTYGWNAYSGSGDIVAEVVYANYGTRDDFAKLRALGVDCTGKLVIARYGGNFRGDKVRFAEAAGATGLILYSDPADVAKGPVYPEGGWANDTCIQRGSVLRLSQPGDPLTPGVAATLDAPRLEVDAAGLPRIPVQPIGYAAAGAILGRMTGAEVPEAWRGGLALPYRVEGGPELRLRLRVQQQRAISRTANVIATLPGATDEFVVIGCHHDAWGFGAADPLAGTIVLMETAKAFARAAQQGWRPQRTVVFGAWAAEEFGIIGSTEWCELHADRIASRCVAYVNLDMASMGTNFTAKSAPMLFDAIRDAAGEVPHARDGQRTVLDAWRDRSKDGVAVVGLIDGGSDHEAFQFNLGVPSCQLAASGGAGTSYHSNYDTLGWYRKVVGEDYEPALMVTRVCVELVDRLADAPMPPLRIAALAPFLRSSLAELDAMVAQRRADDTTDRARTGATLTQRLEPSIAALEEATSLWSQVAGRDSSSRAIAAVQMAQIERAWLRLDADAPWHRHLLLGTDPDAGYTPVALPHLRRAVLEADASATATAVTDLEAAIRRAAIHLSGPSTIR